MLKTRNLWLISLTWLLKSGMSFNLLHDFNSLKPKNNHFLKSIGTDLQKRRNVIPKNVFKGSHCLRQLIFRLLQEFVDRSRTYSPPTFVFVQLSH
jgi:hypothetical protein